jgi:hypothetical protein
MVRGTGRPLDRSVVYSDILEQALTLPCTVDMLDGLRMPELAVRPGASFVFTGCGSSYYTAQSGAQLMRGLSDASAYAVPGSEVWLLPEL